MNDDDKSWLALPKLEGVKWVYANDWWDYVLAGVVSHQGKRYYAFIVDENHAPQARRRKEWWRRFLVVDLDETTWKAEDERHALFVEKVGDHFEFDLETQERKLSPLKPHQHHSEFYDVYRNVELPNYQSFPRVGWFEV